MNIFDYFLESSSRYGSKPALLMKSSGENISYTYSELSKKVEKAKKLLISKGIRPGDRIGIISENRPEWIITYFAILSSKATAVPLDFALTAPEILKLIQFADLKAVLLSRKAITKFQSILPKELVALDIQNSFDYLPGSPKSVQSHQSGDENSSLATIVFTSGTTGNPKGVMLTHESIIGNARYSQQNGFLSSQDRIISIIPLHHMYGISTIALAGLFGGSCLVFLETVQRENILKVLKEEKITVLPAVPRLFESIHTNIQQQIQEKGSVTKAILNSFEWVCKKTKFLFGKRLAKRLFKKIHRGLGGHIRLLVSGGAPLNADIAKAFENWGFVIVNGYGMTESAPIIATNSAKQNLIGSVGKPISYMEVKIDKININGEGEICCRGPSIMKGYFRNPEATKQVLIDGWLHTGDLGKLNDRGFLSITGRIKEMIMTSSGKKASPEEIESYYHNIPGVKEIAIVGIRSPISFGEDIAALVTTQPDIAEQNVIKSIHSRSSQVPSYLRIQHIHFANEIPKTTTLKFKRGQIRKLIEEGPQKINDEQTSITTSDTVAATIIDLIKKEFPTARTTLNEQTSLQYELGMDSLGRMDIAAAIESHFKINLDPEKVFAALTIGDLVSLIKVEKPKAASKENKKLMPKNISSWRWPILSLIKYTSKLLWKLEGEYIENIPENRNYIFVPNHQSHLDVFWVMSCLPSQMQKKLKAFAKRELFDNFGTRIFAEAAGSIPVDRTGNILGALEQGCFELQQGYSLLIHPEGTRSKSGQLGPFQGGAAHLAIKAQVPVIPVYIEGGTSIYPPQIKLPRLFNWGKKERYSLKVYFGKPIEPPKDASREAEVIFTQIMRDAVQNLMKDKT